MASASGWTVISRSKGATEKKLDLFLVRLLKKSEVCVSELQLTTIFDMVDYADAATWFSDTA